MECVWGGEIESEWKEIKEKLGERLSGSERGREWEINWGEMAEGGECVR